MLSTCFNYSQTIISRGHPFGQVVSHQFKQSHLEIKQYQFRLELISQFKRDFSNLDGVSRSTYLMFPLFSMKVKGLILGCLPMHLTYQAFNILKYISHCRPTCPHTQIYIIRYSDLSNFIRLIHTCIQIKVSEKRTIICKGNTDDVGHQGTSWFG